MKKSTIVDLVSELEKLNPSQERDLIISEAKAGEFHDFKSMKYEAPKIALAQLLNQYAENNKSHHEEIGKILDDVMNGKYDE